MGEKKWIDEREDTQKPDGNGVGSGKGGLSRRDFLKVCGTAGGAVVLGSVMASEGSVRLKPANRYGMLTDLTVCVGCRSCEEACNRENDLPSPRVPFNDPSVFDEVRRPTEKAYTVVNRFPNPRDPDKPIYRKVQCNHCNEPACASACPVRAYTKTPEGPVLYNPDVCFGCRYCMVACPFYVPAYDYWSALEPKVVKCLMCYDRVGEGKIPACAEACPVGAVTFGKRDDLIWLAREKIMKNPERYVDHVYGEREAGGTSWLYISGVPFEELGFPTDIPDKPLIENVKGFLSAVPVVLVVWPALLGMCYAATKQRERDNDVGSDAERNEKEDM